MKQTKNEITRETAPEYPDLDQALEMLAQEAAGAPPTGIFYYDGGTQ